MPFGWEDVIFVVKWACFLKNQIFKPLQKHHNHVHVMLLRANIVVVHISYANNFGEEM